MTTLYFAIPGDLNTLTGGYAYDRELIAALLKLNVKPSIVPLSARFPAPDAEALAHAAQQLAAIPDDSLVLVDGLAGGVMDEIFKHEHRRLRLISLCHHPLAFESGIDETSRQARLQSERISLQCSRAIVVTSTATADLLTREFDIPASAITVALPGTSAQQFARCEGNPPVLLTVATLIPRKAHDVLIKALQRIADLRWQARFVGGDHFDPLWSQQIRQQCETSGLGERISFAGSIADLRPEYINADLFVLPSRFEGYGMVFAEALSFGLPVVAANAGAVPDVVPASAGVLVPVDNDEALASALRALLSDRAQFQRLREGAQQAAARLPNWQDTANTVYRLLQNQTG